jgi:thiol-disulfide isomerase/thioredoxin
MSKYRSAVSFLLWTASLLYVSQVSAALPDRLREHNFNFYSAPCPANDMLLQNVNGGVINLSSLRGKVVILNFWKIDCPPCSTEKPILEKIRRKYAGRGLEIVAVNLFDSGDRLKSYCQSGHFGFIFAFDPENRFSIRKQNLASGLPTTFVINSNSEAIYEVPGLPTTYLINRNGEVVGNSVGMVNWEEEPFAQLLDSLLGPPTDSVAQNGRDFSTIAGQGHPHQIAQAQTSPSLPFQQQGASPATTPRVLGPQAPVPELGLAPGQSPTKPQVAKPGTATQPGKKTQTAKPGTAAGGQKKATQVRQPSPGAVAPGAGTPGVGAASSRKPATPTPFVAQPAPPTSGAPLPAGTATLPPLPPAMPYVPGGTRAARPSVVPDEQGNVMARIPESGQGGYPGDSTSPAGAAGQLPPAQAVTGRNPIGGFIMDSFGHARPASGGPSPAAGVPPSQAPATSIFDQLNQDIQALGSGIKETFSRVLPGR